MGRERTHIVKGGETLESIARSYGYKSWKPLWKVNRKALEKKARSPDRIQAGDLVVVPYSDKEKQDQNVRHVVLTAQRFYAEMQAAKYDAWAKEWDASIGRTKSSEKVNIKLADDYLRETRSNYKKVKNAGDLVDRGQMLIDMKRNITKLSVLAKKSATASADELVKINAKTKEIAKDLLNVPRGALKEEITEELQSIAKKYVSVELRGGMKDAMDVVDSFKKTADDLTSVKFYFKTTAALLTGRGWTQAVQDDFEEETDSQIGYWERFKREAVRESRIKIARFEDNARRCRELANLARGRARMAAGLIKLNAL